MGLNHAGVVDVAGAGDGEGDADAEGDGDAFFAAIACSNATEAASS